MDRMEGLERLLVRNIALHLREEHGVHLRVIAKRLGLSQRQVKALVAAYTKQK